MDESAMDFENYVCYRNMENDVVRRNSADSPSKRIKQVSQGTGCVPFVYEPVLKLSRELKVRHKKTSTKWWQQEKATGKTCISKRTSAFSIDPKATALIGENKNKDVKYMHD
jgi:hypothetical protein